MNNTEIAVRVYSEEESIYLQKYLFSIGCRWRHSGVKIVETRRPIIVINNKTLTCAHTVDSILLYKNRYTFKEFMVRECFNTL